MKNISYKLGGVVLAVIFGGQIIAQGAPTLTLNDGVGNSVSLAVGGAPILTGSALTTFFQTGPGFVNWSGSLGVWSFNLGTGNTEPLQGTAQLPMMTLNFQSNGNSAPGNLTFTWSDSNLGPTPGNDFMAQIGGTLAAGVTLTYSTFYSLANTMPAATPLNVPQTFNTPGGFNGSTTVNIGAVAAPYSLTQVLLISNPTAAGTFSGNAQLIAVPEPASVALLLGAGLGVAVMRSIRTARNRK